MTAAQPQGHLSQETLDLLQLKALDDARSTTARSHLDACGACKGRLDELAKDAQHFEQFVFARSLPRLEQRLAKRSLFSLPAFRWLVPVLGAGSAMAVIAAVSLSAGTSGTETEDEVYIGMKGVASEFAIFALRANSQRFQVQQGASMRPGDKLRFVVNPGKDTHVLVASKDGAGAFSVYYPFAGATSVPMEPAVNGRVELPGAVELDATLGEERLWAVFSDRPVSSADVEAAVKANPLTPQVPGARIVTWTFTKVAK